MVPFGPDFWILLPKGSYLKVTMVEPAPVCDTVTREPVLKVPGVLFAGGIGEGIAVCVYYYAQRVFRSFSPANLMRS